MTAVPLGSRERKIEKERALTTNIGLVFKLLSELILLLSFLNVMIE